MVELNDDGSNFFVNLFVIPQENVLVEFKTFQIIEYPLDKIPDYKFGFIGERFLKDALVNYLNNQWKRLEKHSNQNESIIEQPSKRSKLV